METVSSAPTIKQRRKFERIETSNINNQDTSSVNHVSDVYAIGKVSKCMHEEIQTLADCCKETIKKYFLQEEKEYRRRFNDFTSHSSNQEKHPKMKKALLYVIGVTPIVISFITFPITYVMCINASHADLGFLYISDTAVDYPESSIATQSLNITAVAVFLTGFIRHLVLNQYIQDCGQDRIQKNFLNKTFWIGILVPLSVQIIGNFPAVNGNNNMVHFTAVLIYFMSTITYIIMQTKITYCTIEELSDRRIYYIRYTITIILLITACAACVPGIISWQQFNGENYRKWRPNDGGWICHVISVIAEWMFVLASQFYAFSLTYEFRLITFYMPVIKFSRCRWRAYSTVDKTYRGLSERELRSSVHRLPAIIPANLGLENYKVMITLDCFEDTSERKFSMAVPFTIARQAYYANEFILSRQ